MKPFKIAAVLLVVYALMHTVGGMLMQESMGAESDRVFAEMKASHFDFNGSDSTWYGFWFGFGIMVSAFLVMSAVVAWKLEGVGAEHWPHVSFVAWSLCAAHAVCTVLGAKYFFAGPAVFGVAITALLAFGAWKKGAQDSKVKMVTGAASPPMAR